MPCDFFQLVFLLNFLLFSPQLFFGDKGSYHLCEKRLQRIEELCQKLPVSDPVRGTLESSQRILKDLKSQIDSTYTKLTEHSDTWKGYKSRCHLNPYLGLAEPHAWSLLYVSSQMSTMENVIL